MIGIIARIKRLIVAEARVTVLEAQIKDLKDQLDLAEDFKRDLLDRLLVACGAAPMYRAEAPPSGPSRQRPGTEIQPPARNMRDYQFLAERALNEPVADLPRYGAQ